MTSMRLLGKLLDRGSHCLVEWDEPGNPRNVVLRKTVAGANGVDSDDSIAVGSLCYVDVRSGSKKARYQATLLGIGSKVAMDQMLGRIEDRDMSPEADSPERVRKPQKKATKRPPTAAQKQFHKKQSAQENDRITAQLLEGLGNSPFSVLSQQNTPSPVRPNTPLPVRPNTPPPVRPNTSSPVRPNTPPPLRPNTPSPLRPNTPSPLRPNTPSPVRPNTPSPVRPNTPSPLRYHKHTHSHSPLLFPSPDYRQGQSLPDPGFVLHPRWPLGDVTNTSFVHQSSIPMTPRMPFMCEPPPLTSTPSSMMWFSSQLILKNFIGKLMLLQRRRSTLRPYLKNKPRRVRLRVAL